MSSYRQGDVFLFPVDSFPDGVKVREDTRLAIGTSQNHAHTIVRGTVFEKDGALFVTAMDDTTLEHVDQSGGKADHEPINVAMGKYRVKIQDQYTPEGWRQVVD